MMAVLFALWLTLADLGTGVLYGPSWIPSWEAVFASGMSLFFVAWLLYLVTAVPVTWGARRWLGWDQWSSRLGVASFWMFFFRFAGFCGLLNTYRSVPHMMKLAGAISLTLLAGWIVAYLARKGLRAGRSPGVLCCWLFLLPFLIAELVAGLWWRVTWPLVSVHICTLGVALTYIATWMAALGMTGLLGESLGRRKSMVVGLMIWAFLPVAGLSIRDVLERKKISRVPGSGIRKVLLVTVDTLRRDSLRCYEPSAPPTPGMDLLAGEGTMFLHAVASSPWTLPSFASLMTGTSPAVHLAVDKGSRLPDRIPCMAEYLGSVGFFGAGIVCNPYLGRVYKINKGLDHYHDLTSLWSVNPLGFKLARSWLPRRLPMGFNTEQVSLLAVRWLRRYGDRSFFLWLHILDPHLPYSPPSGLEECVEGPDKQAPRYPATMASAIRNGDHKPSEAEKRWARILYEGEVRNVDRAISRVVNALRSQGILEETLVVLLSDHGEEFWDHDGFEHGHTVYGELLNVPLILRGPGIPKARVVPARVSLEGLVPTVLDLCEVPYVPETFSSTSWLPLLRECPERTWKPRPVVASGTLHGPERTAVYWENHKLMFISEQEQGIEEGIYFDLQADPFEINPMREGDLDSEVVDGLLSALAGHVADSERLRAFYGIQEAAGHKVNSHLMRELRALGYVD